MTLIQTTGKKPVYSLVLVTYINTDGAMFSETYFVVSRFFFIKLGYPIKFLVERKLLKLISDNNLLSL